ncbi:hypothetical protein K438DRAFT_2029847 [Mycena galopus ATCC 62051]|nr:hypothetical protein K438DRAFT_2029847 [Mycena galopus ATCC 62051]
MGSQLTLVTIPPPVRLTFSRNDMKHATLSLGFVPTYTTTTDAKDACTELRSTGSGVLLARIIRRAFLPDTIMFPAVDSGHEMKLAQWLKKTKAPDGSSRHIFNIGHARLILMMHPVYRLTLFQEGHLEIPVAHWEQSTTTSPPVLIIQDPTWGSEPKSLRPSFFGNSGCG